MLASHKTIFAQVSLTGFKINPLRKQIESHQQQRFSHNQNKTNSSVCAIRNAIWWLANNWHLSSERKICEKQNRKSESQKVWEKYLHWFYTATLQTSCLPYTNISRFFPDILTVTYFEQRTIKGALIENNLCLRYFGANLKDNRVQSEFKNPTKIVDPTWMMPLLSKVVTPKSFEKGEKIWRQKQNGPQGAERAGGHSQLDYQKCDVVVEKESIALLTNCSLHQYF